MRTHHAQDALSRYLQEIRRYPLLSPDEERDLARRVQDGDRRAATALVEGNLRFVVRVARRYVGYGFPLGDLIQEGNLGLMRAVEKYDPERGIRFASYAVWWIRAFIQNYVIRSWSMVKMGTTQTERALFFGLAKARRDVAKVFGAEAADDPATLASWMGLPEKEVRRMQGRTGAHDTSLDTPYGDDGVDTLVNLVQDGSRDPFDEVSAEEVRALVSRRIEEQMNDFDEREQAVVRGRLLTDEPELLRELGARMGVSRERVRQIQLKVEGALRGSLSDLDTDPAAVEPPHLSLGGH